MSNLDDCTFYGWLRSPMGYEETIRDGLFKSHKTWHSGLELLFYEKGGRLYEFFTKEDITDLVPSNMIGGKNLGFYNSSLGPYRLDPLSFAERAKAYKYSASRISVFLQSWRQKQRAEIMAKDAEKKEKQRKDKENLDWLKNNL